MFHVCDLPEVYRNYFTVKKSVHSYDTIGKVMVCIFITSRNQLAKELFSILEVFCLYHQFLRNACLKII